MIDGLSLLALQTVSLAVPADAGSEIFVDIAVTGRCFFGSTGVLVDDLRSE